ncbi:MAG: hypothetical protein ABI691_17575 [Ginsengibacter sp.]
MNKISATPVVGKSEVSGKFKMSKPNTGKARYFFVAMAILFPVVVFLGFFPSFQGMNQGTLEISWLTHIHSAIMTSWILLFLIQTILAATGNLKIHRRLGLLSVVLGILVFLVMGMVSFNIVIVNHPPEGSFLFDLLLIDFYEMLCFALFFTWGMLSRKINPATHKRLLTLATFVLLTAAVDRFQRDNSFPSLGMEYPAFSFIYLDTLLIPLFLYDLITLKGIHKITLLGTAIVILFQVVVSNVYGSPSWHRFWFELTAPFVKKIVEIKLSDAQSAPLLGDYESALGKIAISQNNSNLYVQFNGEEKQELGATSETELFMKGETMTFSFIKESNGKVLTANAKQIGRIFKMTRVQGP